MSVIPCILYLFQMWRLLLIRWTPLTYRDLIVRDLTHPYILPFLIPNQCFSNNIVPNNWTFSENRVCNTVILFCKDFGPKLK